METEVKCTKDCVLYHHRNCYLNPHAGNDKKKHRTVCNSPTPGSYKEKEFDIYTMLDNSEYHPEPKKKRAAKLNMPQIAVGKNRVPRPKVYEKPVVQMDMDGHVIKRHKSVSAAAKAIGKHPANIHRAAQGKSYKTAYGFKWKFINK